MKRNIVVCQDSKIAPFEQAREIQWDLLQRLNVAIAKEQVTFTGRRGSVHWHTDDPLRKLRQMAIHAPTQYENVLSACNISKEQLDSFHQAVLQHSEQTNVDQVLCDELRDQGHSVVLYDGWRIDARHGRWEKETNVEHAASECWALWEEFRANGLVLDLDLHGNHDFGRIMLSHIESRVKRIPDLQVVIYSKFLAHPGNTRAELSTKFNALKIDFVDRGAGDTHAVVVRKMTTSPTP